MWGWWQRHKYSEYFSSEITTQGFTTFYWSKMSHYCYFLTFSLLAVILNGLTQAEPQVVYVDQLKSPTHTAEYQCIAEANPENSEYRWYRGEWNPLPEGVRAEGDRLHFLTSACELDGLYICKAENELGVATGSLYRKTCRHTEL